MSDFFTNRPPWVRPAVVHHLKTLAGVGGGTGAGAAGGGERPQQPAAQIIQVRVREQLMVLSDLTHSIECFVLPEALEQLNKDQAGRSLPSLRGGIVFLEDWAFAQATQVASASPFLKCVRVSLVRCFARLSSPTPWCRVVIVCRKFRLYAGTGNNPFGNPFPVCDDAAIAATLTTLAQRPAGVPGRWHRFVQVWNLPTSLLLAAEFQGKVRALKTGPGVVRSAPAAAGLHSAAHASCWSAVLSSVLACNDVAQDVRVSESHQRQLDGLSGWDRGEQAVSQSQDSQMDGWVCSGVVLALLHEGARFCSSLTCVWDSTTQSHSLSLTLPRRGSANPPPRQAPVLAMMLAQALALALALAQALAQALALAQAPDGWPRLSQ